MADSTSIGEETCSLTVLKSETKLIMEAFLRRVQMEGGTVGHVGRYYHDEKKYKAKTPDRQDSISVKVHKHRRSLFKGTLEREDEEKRRSLKHSQGTEEDTGWGTSDEEICQAEEKKHGFKTAIKKLIRRQKRKGSSTLEKSKDSLDFIEACGPPVGTTKPDSKANSLKRRENIIISLPASDFAHVGDLEGSVGEGVNIRAVRSKHKKSGQWFLNLLRKGPKKSDNHHPEKDQVPSSPSRPTTLALNLCPTEDENSEFYTEAAKKLEKLAQKCFSQTGDDYLTSKAQFQGPVIANNNQSAIERIVQVLQDQGDQLNEKVKDNPVLQRPMSFRSFKQLVEAFTANVEGQIEDQATSPELAKIALTMELTRRVAGISSHPVQQLMGYSMQYMDMFVPWLQEQGGWKKVLPLDDFSEHPID